MSVAQPEVESNETAPTCKFAAALMIKGCVGSSHQRSSRQSIAACENSYFWTEELVVAWRIMVVSEEFDDGCDVQEERDEFVSDGQEWHFSLSPRSSDAM